MESSPENLRNDNFTALELLCLFITCVELWVFIFVMATISASWTDMLVLSKR